MAAQRRCARVSLLVGRVLGTVVVTVDGALNREGSELLAGVLSDLIEGQGNLAVAVHLGKAIVDPEAVTVFAEAATRASERGAKFILEKPPIETQEALRAGGICGPRRGPSAPGSSGWLAVELRRAGSGSPAHRVPASV